MQETAGTSSCDEEQEKEKEPLVVISHMAGMSEDIRRVCGKFNIRVVFKSGRTLRSMLTKVKDTLLSSAVVQHCGLLPVDWMVILPRMLRYS